MGNDAAVRHDPSLFQFYYPHANEFAMTFPHPIGTITVGPQGSGKEFVPTPDHIRRGVTLELLGDFEGPSFLRRTPAAIRREALERAGFRAPAALVEATKNTPRYAGRGVAPADMAGAKTPPAPPRLPSPSGGAAGAGVRDDAPEGATTVTSRSVSLSKLGGA